MSNVTVIEPKKWYSLELGEVWQSREILFFLAWRDIKARYKQSVLGISWAILQPLITVVVFSVVFGQVVGLSSKTSGIPYPLFVLTGVLPWQFFSRSVGGASRCLIGNNFITKIYFPRLLIPVSAIAVTLVDFAIAFLMLVAMLIWYQVPLDSSVLLLPIYIGTLIAFAVSFGILFSAISVKYRDLLQVIPFFIQLGMYITPVVYPLSLVPSHLQWIVRLNPITGILEGIRYCLLDVPFDPSIYWSFALAGFLLFISILVFKNTEKSFADIA